MPYFLARGASLPYLKLFGQRIVGPPSVIVFNNLPRGWEEIANHHDALIGLWQYECQDGEEFLDWLYRNRYELVTIHQCPNFGEYKATSEYTVDCMIQGIPKLRRRYNEYVAVAHPWWHIFKFW